MSVNPQSACSRMLNIGGIQKMRTRAKSSNIKVWFERMRRAAGPDGRACLCGRRFVDCQFLLVCFLYG